MEFANNFDALLISKDNPSFFKSPCLGACEVVITTKTKIRSSRALMSLRK